MPTAIVIHEKDNVATALADVEAGVSPIIKCREATVDGPQVTARIPFGHKFAVVPIPKGEYIMKYGEVIGQATQNIGAGDHVHVHNVVSLRGRGDLAPRA